MEDCKIKRICDIFKNVDFNQVLKKYNTCQTVEYTILRQIYSIIIHYTHPYYSNYPIHLLNPIINISTILYLFDKNRDDDIKAKNYKVYSFLLNIVEWSEIK